jgi:tRNA modification GTPase
VLRWIADPATGERIDQALVLAFQAPASFTGEDVAELQLHGGRATVRAVLATLGRRPGLREAAPGEFTRRALLNGRLDLLQVEGLGDLLAAETAAQHRQAVSAMAGAVSAMAEAWRDRLTRILAFIEAGIDFADEELPDDLIDAVAREIDALLAVMTRELQAGEIAERVREGFEVALVGRPNVGKSTLLNAIARRDVVLTSATAGTTRDVIEVRMDLRGLPLTLLDMAGLRDTGDEIEALGVERGRRRADAADMRIFLVDDPSDAAELGVAVQAGDYVALAKGDRRRPGTLRAVSGLTGDGMGDLLDAIAETLEPRSLGAGLLAHARQRTMIAEAVDRLQGARTLLVRDEAAMELAEEEVRGAIRGLDALTGRVDVEAVLDVIFRNFCLGK